MKTLKQLLVVTVAVLLASFTLNTPVTALPDKELGIYLFIRSKPVNKFESLGPVNMPEVVWSGRPNEMIDIAVRRVKRQYPNANGIIFLSERMGKVEAIKLSE